VQKAAAHVFGRQPQKAALQGFDIVGADTAQVQLAAVLDGHQLAGGLRHQARCKAFARGRAQRGFVGRQGKVEGG